VRRETKRLLPLSAFSYEAEKRVGVYVRRLRGSYPGAGRRLIRALGQGGRVTILFSSGRFADERIQLTAVFGHNQLSRCKMHMAAKIWTDGRAPCNSPVSASAGKPTESAWPP
jgi:hypothetical protein